MEATATTLHFFRCLTVLPPLGRSLLVLALVAIFAVKSPTAVVADEMHMGWDGCTLEGASEAAQFACDTDAGAHVVVTSFVLNSGFSGFVALEAYVFIGTIGTNSTLPDWWKTTAGSCREGAITTSFDFLDSPQVNCFDPWFGQAISSPTMIDVITTPDLPPHGSSTFSRVRLGATLPSGSTDLEAGKEYLAFKLRVSHAGTTGPEACDACCERAGLMVSQMTLFNAADAVTLINQSAPAEWQAPTTGCRPVPALARSWGQVRGMYR